MLEVKDSLTVESFWGGGSCLAGEEIFLVMEGAAEVPWSQEPTNGAVLNNLKRFHTYILIKHMYLK